jgi:hypothetical protein
MATLVRRFDPPTWVIVGIVVAVWLLLGWAAFG